jgi:rubrerythrin
MAQASKATGTADPTYDVISILYHALQGAETYTKYAQDAERAGDRELAQFFREVQQQETQCADRAKQLLARRLQRAEATA